MNPHVLRRAPILAVICALLMTVLFAVPVLADEPDTSTAPLFDSGDAPDFLNPGQTVGPLRASHTIVLGAPFLGLVPPDAEFDGLPSFGANGDDFTFFDDEDGLVSVGPGIWGEGAGTINVGVNVAAAPRACVYAWVDWAGDGFGVGSDSTAQGSMTSTGILELAFTNNLPAMGAFPPAAYLRLRVVSGPFGCAPLGSPGHWAIGWWPDGEVEDHILYFGPNAVNISGFAAVPAATAWPVAAGLVTILGLAGAGLRRRRGGD